MSFAIDPGAHPRRLGAGPDVIPVPDSVLQARAERPRSAAESAGYSGLAIFSLGARQMSGTSTHGFLRYLLDWFSGGGCATMILPVHGDPVVVVPGPSDVGDLRERVPWIADRRGECLTAFPRDLCIVR